MPGNNNDLSNNQQQNFVKSERFAKQAEREARELETFSRLQKRMENQSKEYLKTLMETEKVQKRIAELEESGLTHQEAHINVLKAINKEYREDLIKE